MAVKLGVTVLTIKRRESGQTKITDQDAADLRRLAAGPKPEPTETPRPLHADTTPRKRTGDPLRDNIEHWYVNPGYVLS
jgi:hypothetical protein